MARYQVRQIALDGNDLDAMIEFWAAALGYEMDHRDEGYAVLRDPDRTVLADPEGNEFCVGDFG